MTLSAIAPALPIVAILLLFAGIGRAPRIELVVRDAALRVALGLWDRLYCMRGNVVLPLAEIKEISVSSRDLLPVPGMRFPGTAVPGVIRAGSYRTGAHREFWNVRRAATVLVIDLRPGSVYSRILLEVDDPHAEAKRLRRCVQLPGTATP